MAARTSSQTFHSVVHGGSHANSTYHSRPAILAADAASAVIAAPVAAFVTPAAASPQLTGYHASAGTVAPDMTTYHS